MQSKTLQSKQKLNASSLTKLIQQTRAAKESLLSANAPDDVGRSPCWAAVQTAWRYQEYWF
ncbi:hypothetical protein O9993_08585 [Vibrio lentus]|nr:hypothetical protein [Vibrio lentus]